MVRPVSIVIPTKDRPDKLAVAVESALAQTYRRLEVVVQDGSRETAPPVLPDDPRLRYYREHDTSIANALNRGMLRATGEYLHFACDDDVMRPDAVKHAMHSLRTLNYRWTYGQIDIHSPRLPNGDNHVERNGGWDWDYHRLQHGNYIPQPSVFFTRYAWTLCGPWDETSPLCFDYEMWGRLGSRWDPFVREHVDADVHRWEGSISVHSQDAQWTEVRAIQHRWKLYGFGRREGE
jgi:glycosyltransferase involved in cell wall biosynthesis